MLFLLWLRLFILSGVISPPISSSILSTYQPGEFIFQCPLLLPFYTINGVLKARLLKWLSLFVNVQFSSLKQNKQKQKKKKKKKGGKLFKYPNCSWCIFIICLYLSLPLPVTLLVEGILVQIICFIYIFHLHVVNCKLFSLFFVTCRLKNNKYPLSPSYIIKIQLLKLHIIN